MFIQVIQGKVADADGLNRQMDRWIEELRPGATGWVGSTGGVTDDGEAVLLARFESAAAARANSDRPEQGAWWEETAKCFDGEPSFAEGDETETLLGGGSDQAGFVQVMQGRISDPAALRALESSIEDRLRELHTGLLGGVRVWHGDGRFTEANYFTDEATARAGEQAMGSDADLGARLGEWQSLMSDVRFFDLRAPRTDSA